MRLHEMSVRECVDLFNQENRLVNEAMDKAAHALTAFIEAAAPRFIAGGRLIYLGAGTSGRLGVLDASECPHVPNPARSRHRHHRRRRGSLRKTARARKTNGAAPELDALALTSQDIVLGIAAGGTTPYVIGALDHAKKLAQPPLTGMLVCTPISKPASANYLIVLETGPELLTGSTRLKAGTATKLALNTISTTLMIRAGRVYENLMVDVRASNDKLRDRAARIIATITGLSRDDAFSLLDQAGGNVKTAIVMHRFKIARIDAEQRLEHSGGQLAGSDR